MSEVTERFTGRAMAYERYRERYVAEVVLEPLREWCGLVPEWMVADVGAGTGMLAEVFLGNGNRVIAVEPNAEMRMACARVHASEARLAVVDGRAERTGIAAGTIDMVSVGRALHWFDAELAMEEFRRVLKPGGWVAVVAFGRSQGEREENRALELLLRSFTADGEDTQASYAVYSRMREWFAGGEFHHVEKREEVHLGWEELRGLTISLSHAPREDEARFAEFEGELRGVFARYARDGRVTLAVRYWINAGRFGG